VLVKFSLSVANYIQGVTILSHAFSQMLNSLNFDSVQATFLDQPPKLLVAPIVTHSTIRQE
jgi:hypothetical protein